MLTLETVYARSGEIRENKNGIFTRGRRHDTYAKAALELAFRAVDQEPPAGILAERYNSERGGFGGVKLITISRINNRFPWRAVGVSDGTIDDEAIREKALELSQMHSEYVERREARRKLDAKRKERQSSNRTDLQTFAEESGFEISHGGWRMEDENGLLEKWGNVRFEGDDVKVTVTGDVEFAKRLFAFVQAYG